MSNNSNNIGFGSEQFQLAVYIANRPNMSQYDKLENIHALSKGEIAAIGIECGNGWRKVFNVYAKLIFSLKPTPHWLTASISTWQQFRDQKLLQKGSNLGLFFSPPDLTLRTKAIHIICGRTYAKQLLSSKQLNADLIWLDPEFAIDKQKRVIVCPYFDYRQLSNIKIEYLAQFIFELDS